MTDHDLGCDYHRQMIPSDEDCTCGASLRTTKTENERLNKECGQLRALLQEAFYVAKPDTKISVDAIFILSQRGWFDDVRALLNSKE